MRQRSGPRATRPGQSHRKIFSPGQANHSRRCSATSILPAAWSAFTNRTCPRSSSIVLKINAGSFSFEAANPRHEHEYHLFERMKLPDGKVLCPGMITHASNIVEHPEFIAERILRYANLVGRENVMAGADCGFS